MKWIGYGMCFVATAAAVIYGIHVTRQWGLLWFMFIPAIIDSPD